MIWLVFQFYIIDTHLNFQFLHIFIFTYLLNALEICILISKLYSYGSLLV